MNEKKTGSKEKKTPVKKILLIIAIAVLVLIALIILIPTINARRIPHHFASAKEGRELFLAKTEYYSDFTQNDIDYRLKKSGGTLDEFLEVSANDIKSFNLLEKYLMNCRISKMARKLKKEGYTLPQSEEVVYIKTKMSTEGGNSGFTLGNEIYLSSMNIVTGLIPGAGQYFEHLMWHELYHTLSRNNPDFRAEMYSLINFTVTDSDFEMPPCVRDLYFKNPDVERHNSYATFIIDGKETDCYLVWLCTTDYAQSGSSMVFRNEPVLVPIDGTDTYYTFDRASNLDEVFGSNTNYEIDPEECMADNFADTMQYGLAGRMGKGYDNPEIIQGVIDILKK